MNEWISVKKVDCPCRTCSHHGEPKCTHTKECYQGEEFAAWERYLNWKRAAKEDTRELIYNQYKSDVFNATIKRRKGK